MARSARRPLAILIAAAAVGGAAACSPIETVGNYAPSDGVRASIGNQIAAENLMIVTTEEGAEGVLVGGLTNRWDERTAVDFLFEGSEGAVTVRLAGNASVLLGPQDEAVTIPAVAAPPGDLLDVQISSPESGSVILSIPVLDGTVPPYDQLLSATGE